MVGRPDLSSAAHSPAAYLEAENERLKNEIVFLLDAIDDESRRNAIYFGGSRQNTADHRAREEMKRELDLTNERILKLRTAIDRSHQISTLRAIEDHMRATKKELAFVNGEIQVLREEAMRQKRVLEGNHSHQLLKSLEREIANERVIHTQLRKEALKIGPSCHVHSKSVTVSS
jgi:hypothetical protein